MSESAENQEDDYHRGAFYASVVLIGLTWPLIWVGGLVTTYDAGMAVPDWPKTYGSNMFLYPWQTWIFGPFDLFIEHGHRLLGSAVGLATIVLVVIAKQREPRKWVRWLCYVALVGVILQGTLGGLRVVLDARIIAMVHGCTGPAFFVLCWIVMAVVSRWWRQPAAEVSTRIATLSLVVSVVSYVQLVLGAQLRHMPIDASRGFFGHIVYLHVGGAVLLAVLLTCFLGVARRCGDLTLSRISLFLILLVVIQWSLGVSTWFVNYGWPLDRWPVLANYVIMAKGWYESAIVTGHVAVGSLIVAVSALATTRAARLAGGFGFAFRGFSSKRLTS